MVVASSLRAFKCEKMWCYWIYNCDWVFLVNVWWLFKVLKNVQNLRIPLGLISETSRLFKEIWMPSKRRYLVNWFGLYHPSSSHTLIEYWSHNFNVVILIAISRGKMQEISGYWYSYTHVFGCKPYTTWLEKYTWGRRFDMF